MFCIISETSLYYCKLLFGKVSPQIFYCETSLFYWFSWVIIYCLIYYSIVHDIDICLFEQLSMPNLKTKNHRGLCSITRYGDAPAHGPIKGPFQMMVYVCAHV